MGSPFACSRVMAVDTWVGWMGPFRHGFTCVAWVILTVIKLLHGLVSILLKWGKIFNI